MVLLESKKIKIGEKLENFTLKDCFNKEFERDKNIGKNGCIIIFTCNHCPYAIAIWKRIIDLSKWAKTQGVNTLAINPNIHPDYPEDNPENMMKKVLEWKIPFPYLIDQDQRIAKAYQAQCTPDIYFIDENKKLFYHGRLDDNWQNEKEVSEESLKNAILNKCQEKPAPKNQKPSIGCSIKWH